MSNLFLWHSTIAIFYILAIQNRLVRARQYHSDGRYSYSLSTFDASGKLAQVEHAIIAANLGTPVAAIATDDAVIMCSPEVIPSPFIIQDGSARFLQITNEIILAHSGLSADGRVLMAAAQRLAVEHEYTFDEDIPIEIFLQEISLLFQEYTMKAAARPFGTSLVVGHNPRVNMRSNRRRQPILYRIDPSGTITASHIVILNKMLEQTDLKKTLETVRKLPTSEVPEAIQRLLEASLEQLSSSRQNDSGGQDSSAINSIVIAMLALNGKLALVRKYPEMRADHGNK